VGMEWTNCRVHLNLIGIENPPPLYVEPTDDQIKEVIQFVHDQGGTLYSQSQFIFFCQEKSNVHSHES
jgi:hypothetical protein